MALLSNEDDFGMYLRARATYKIALWTLLLPFMVLYKVSQLKCAGQLNERTRLVMDEIANLGRVAVRELGWLKVNQLN